MSLSDICSCDWDAPSFYRRALRKARKPHACEECGHKIQAGESYEYVAAKWDGCLSTFYTCERCHDILVWLKNNIPCFCYAHGGAFEDVPELIAEARRIAPDEAAGLWFGYHRRVILRDRYNSRARAAL
jgi:hypothetical protein